MIRMGSLLLVADIGGMPVCYNICSWICALGNWGLQFILTFNVGDKILVFIVVISAGVEGLFITKS